MGFVGRPVIHLPYAIRERVRVLDGTFVVEAIAGHGTRIKLDSSETVSYPSGAAILDEAKCF